MECFNEYYVGEIANFMGKCRFYRKTGCKIGEMEGDLFYEEWFLGMRFRIEFGITLWQYLGWHYNNIQADEKVADNLFCFIN